MYVRNVHRRTIGSPEKLGALLATLASDADQLWPADRWPSLRLDGPLAVGARGGHGPVRYRVESYEPSQHVRFRFERPRGFDGVHEFVVVVDEEASAQLVHVLKARMSGGARLTWPLVFRPLHDALIEDALAGAVVSLGEDAPAGVRRPAVGSIGGPAVAVPDVVRRSGSRARPVVSGGL